MLAAAGGGSLLAGEAEGGNQAVETGAVQCVLTPELTEGPYYIAGEKVRRDIREGHPGTLLTLHLAVLDASSCKPIKGAAVDIWHADAAGELLGLRLRLVEPHVPARHPEDERARARRVHDDLSRLVPRAGRSTSTSRCTSAGASCTPGSSSSRTRSLTKAVYKAAPYTSRPLPTCGTRRTRSSSTAARRAMLAVRKSGAGYVGSIAMGVHP